MVVCFPMPDSAGIPADQFSVSECHKDHFQPDHSITTNESILLNAGFPQVFIEGFGFHFDSLHLISSTISSGSTINISRAPTTIIPIA